MKKKLPILAAVSGVAVAAVYRAVKGHGVFNRLKFQSEHSAVARYIETHHPGATHSSIEKVGEGYTTIINDGTSKYLLTLTATDEGMYIFNEENLTFTF